MKNKNIILAIIVGFMFLFITGAIIRSITASFIEGAKSGVSINVEKCLEKPNFEKTEDGIIETLEEDVVVIDKYTTSKKDSTTGETEKTYFLKVSVPSANNYETEVQLGEDQYSSIEKDENVHLTRVVYYTLEGVRLYYKDIIE